MEFLIVIVLAIAAVAVFLLKIFDFVAGRGPKQVSDGIRRTRDSDDRIPCPMCAERILPQAKICPFCRSNLKT
jgi:hypothetical protein